MSTDAESAGFDEGESVDRPSDGAVESRPPSAAVPAASPDADLLVAHVLLRSGNALPARVHLETLAGRRELDLRGLADLAESRWRTGDLAGAGEAASAYLEAGGEQPIAFLIAAEATAALGRPGEARKLSRRALEGLTLPLDAVFAGQFRASVWPQDPAAAVPAVPTLFEGAPMEAARGGRIGLTMDAAPRPSRSASAPGVRQARVGAGDDVVQAAATDDDAPRERGLWDPSEDGADDARLVPAVVTELDAARDALDAGNAREAGMRLAVVLRVSPALAPAVLDLIADQPGADFDLLRGDALRLVGREAAAERSFAAAADALRATSLTNDPTTRSPE